MLNTANVTSQVEQMYHEWLSGLSIRGIGKKYQLGRMSVFAMFRNRFGKDATNLRKQSLARVVYQEYGDIELAQAAAGSDGLYRTVRAEKNYSKHQTYDCVTVNLAYEYEEPETVVNLNTYLYICKLTLLVLMQCQIHNNRVRLTAYANRHDCTLGDC